MASQSEPPNTVSKRDSQLVERPRFSIAHLILWTAASAMMFAMYRMMDVLISEVVPAAIRDRGLSYEYMHQATRLAHGMLAGASITGGLVVVRLAWQRTWIRPQPGELLLVANGVAAVAVIVGWLAFTMADIQFAMSGAMSSLVYAFVCLSPAVAFLVAGLATKNARLWRVSILIVAALLFLRAAGPSIQAWSVWIGGPLNLYQPISRWLVRYTPLVPFLCCAAIVLPAVRDRCRRVDRGRLHKLGITVLAVQWGVQVVQFIWIRYFL